MVEVKYYRTVSERKKNKVFGIFYTDHSPENETEDAIFQAKCRALDEVREIVGSEGVLVAYIPESEEESV